LPNTDAFAKSAPSRLNNKKLQKDEIIPLNYLLFFLRHESNCSAAAAFRFCERMWPHHAHGGASICPSFIPETIPVDCRSCFAATGNRSSIDAPRFARAGAFAASGCLLSRLARHLSNLYPCLTD
jgi:hypothetical protein